MAGMVIPYIVPLFLGMTYDARSSRPGVDIYDKEFVDKPEVTSFMNTESNYQVVTTMSEVLNALSVSGDLALKIKSGMIDVQGKGSYLKNENEYKDSVMVLTTLTYRSVVKAFDANAKPRDGWSQQYSTEVLGTHFVSSIMYGAEMIASAKFVIYNSSDVNDVKGEVKGTLGSGGTGNELVADGKLDTLQKKLKGKANLEISYYGTVPLKTIPNSIDGLTELITTFDELVKEPGLEDGIPMSVQVNSLTEIADPSESERFEFIPNKNLEVDLSEFSDNMDELRRARTDLSAYARTLPYEIDAKLESEIGEQIQNMTDILQIFYNVLWSMDLTKGPEQLDPAFKAYDYDDSMQSRKYDRLVKRLKNKIENLVDRSRDVASATYVQWGRDNCKGNDTMKLYDGFTFSSAEEGIGGASQYSCAPKTIEKGYDLYTTRGVSSYLAGIRYAEMDRNSNPFKGAYAQEISNGGVTCAKCYSPSSASIAMFSASDECPFMWDLLYEGYLMSSREKNGQTTEYICVDNTPSMPYKMDKPDRQRNTLALTTVRSEGSLPVEVYIQGALIKCVVCAMKSNQVSF